MASLFPWANKKSPFAFINVVPKRIRIIAVTLTMTILVAVSTFFPFTEWWFVFVIVLLLASYITTYLAVYESIDGVEWFTLFIMPILFTIALYFFYSLLPVRWLTRLPFIILFSFGYYAMLLASNIFNVGVEKSIQLYRAAFSVNYLAQAFIVFLLMTVVLSFRLDFFLNSFVLLILTMLLSLQLFWTVHLESVFNRRLVRYSMACALLLFQVSLLLSFVPLQTNVVALVLTAVYYSISGIVYNYLGERLFRNVIREYIFVMSFVCVIALLTLQW